MPMKILSVEGLKTYFDTDHGVVRAVDGVSFSLDRGEVLGIVGESGSGKSVTQLTLMGLIPRPPGRVVGGKVLFKGADLLKLSPAALRALRGDRVAMIFQDPMTSLNPFLKVSKQLIEALRAHRKEVSKHAAKRRAIELLRKVGIPDPERRINQYPHQFSGGMRQRVMIAMALMCDPELLIADEPTTALDATIQAQILELIRSLRDEFGTSVILITHDLGVVAGMADRVIVMYGGRVMEEAPTRALFARPGHPYTVGLLESVPRLDGDLGQLLKPIPGLPPDLSRPPSGCPFHPRCPSADERCQNAFPEPWYPAPDHRVYCWRPELLAEHAEAIAVGKQAPVAPSDAAPDAAQPREAGGVREEAPDLSTPADWNLVGTSGLVSIFDLEASAAPKKEAPKEENDD